MIIKATNMVHETLFFFKTMILQCTVAKNLEEPTLKY